MRAFPLHLHRASDDNYFTSHQDVCSQVSISGLTHSGMAENFAVVCIGFLSITAASVVAYLMYNHKPLMAHPNKLIFGMCLCEAAAAWHAIISHIGVKTWICYFGLDSLFMSTSTILWNGSELETLQMLEANNYNILCYLEFFSLALNFYLCLDIILTMRSPFHPHGRRLKWYLVGSAAIATLLFYTTTNRLTMEARPHAEGEKPVSIQTKAMFGVFFLSSYIMFSMFSVAYAYRINTRPGMSSDIRRSFVRGHLEYVLCYVFTWLPYLGLNYFLLFATSRLGNDVEASVIQSNPDYKSAMHRWEDAYMYSSMMTGFLMSIVRIREPLFWNSASVYLDQFFGDVSEADPARRKGMDGTMLSFLMSSLNIELVHIILTAVSTRTVGMPKSKDNHRAYQDYDHSNKHKFVIDNIEIPDKKNWDVDQVIDETIRGRRTTFGRFSVNSKKQAMDDGKLIINEDIQVTEYAPDVFAFLRQKDGYSNEVLRQSLNPEANKKMVFKAGESQGKSGSFFFFSQDQQFIIKTMTEEDFDAFTRIQKKYF